MESKGGQSHLEIKGIDQEEPEIQDSYKVLM